MARYFIELSYNGENYCGWQKQPNAPSVQNVIEETLTKLNGNETIEIVGCGRTDAGVHAQEYFVHFDLDKEIDAKNWAYKLNKMLPKDIAIHAIFPVSDELHARFSAEKRTYRYFIHQTKNPFRSNLSWYYPQKLDLTQMNKAAEKLIGTKDFTSFSKLHSDVKSNICSVYNAQWNEDENGIYFEISANRFLRNMVRSIVGTLMEVGLRKQNSSFIEIVLNAQNRQEAAVSVPAHGLYLWKIEYPTL